MEAKTEATVFQAQIYIVIPVLCIMVILGRFPVWDTEHETAHTRGLGLGRRHVLNRLPSKCMEQQDDGDQSYDSHFPSILPHLN